MLAHEAQAQQQQDIPAAPPAEDLNTFNPMTAPRVEAAPRLSPLLSPQDQADKLAQELVAQQGRTQQNPAQNQAAMEQYQQQMAFQQQQQQQIPQQIPQGMPQQQAPLAVATPAPQAEAAATPAAPAPDVAAQPLQPVDPVKATTSQGFAPAQNAALPTNSSGTIPMPAGMMPTASGANAGMDMNINPDMVGGYDISQPAGPNNPIPYEVQLEQRTQEIQQKARAMAFEQAKKTALPMETYEIRDVLGRLKDTQEAIQTPVRPAPTPGNVIKTISTDPAAKPEIIRLATGNVTTLNIVDVTGEPWPIVDIGFGGPFDVKPPEPGGHVVRITPLKDFARGNLVIRLLKVTTPITFSLQAGGDTVNYRFDARLAEYGPNAKMPLIEDGIHAIAGDKITSSFLEGVIPTGAEKMTVDGIDGRTSAYRYAGTTYVRTPLSLLSPAWQGSATSADGMNVYILNNAPVLLLSDKGALVRARVSDSKKTTSGF